ncbi:MAG TPA: ATP-binding protein [Ramlibacter sp.]|nr:ATP-binding protein [Ramlibacter sp.]
MAEPSPALVQGHHRAPLTERPAATQLALAAAATALATGACWWLDTQMSVAGLAMVYLVVVALAAMLLSRWASLAASLMCVTALNYFFVPPRGSFTIDGAEYWWTLSVLLALSLAVNTLIANLRERRARAELGETRAAQLHALSEALAQTSDPVAAAKRAAQWLAETLHHPCAVFLREDDSPALRCHGVPAAETGFHPMSAQWAIDHGRPLGRGCPDWPDLPLWCAPLARRGAGGAVQVLLPSGSRPTEDTLLHWQSLVRQIGLSVERERAAQSALLAHESARSEAERNTLLASLSHDLRTPLAGIVGSASALRTQGEAMPAAQRTRLLANLENEARDMTLMADNILQMARLAQPLWQLRTQWESAEEILGAAVARMRRRWDGARIQLRVSPGLPPVQAEAGLLVQVIANLVDNAVRHSGPEPDILVQAGRSRDGIFIAVRDHGAGLAASDVAGLFDRYRQGAGSAKSGGAGLGLAICRAIVEAHGGRIEARPCEPGTEFRFDLPAVAAAEETQPHG